MIVSTNFQTIELLDKLFVENKPIMLIQSISDHIVWSIWYHRFNQLQIQSDSKHNWYIGYSNVDQVQQLYDLCLNNINQSKLQFHFFDQYHNHYYIHFNNGELIKETLDKIDKYQLIDLIGNVCNCEYFELIQPNIEYETGGMFWHWSQSMTLDRLKHRGHYSQPNTLFPIIKSSLKDL